VGFRSSLDGLPLELLFLPGLPRNRTHFRRGLDLQTPAARTVQEAQVPWAQGTRRHTSSHCDGPPPSWLLKHNVALRRNNVPLRRKWLRSGGDDEPPADSHYAVVRAFTDEWIRTNRDSKVSLDGSLSNTSGLG
jgi:hypothetical protein